MLDWFGPVGRIASVVLALSIAAACAPAATVEEVEWGYEGETGPEAWGQLSPDYALCELGAEQSPINLADPIRTPLPGPEFRYRAAPVEFANLGHTLQFSYAPGSSLMLGETAYELVQYHFHTPAEHLLQGEHYPMALHLVHRNDAGELAVVGVLIREGRERTELRPLWENLPTTPGEVYRDPARMLSAEALLPQERTNYRYPGSLTTPPCTEGVRWIVMAEPIEMSPAQIRAVRDIIHTTNRPTMPLGERTLLLDPAG